MFLILRMKSSILGNKRKLSNISQNLQFFFLFNRFILKKQTLFIFHILCIKLQSFALKLIKLIHLSNLHTHSPQLTHPIINILQLRRIRGE